VLSVLTEAAIDVDKIDSEAVQAARQRAEEALAKASEEGLDPAEVEKMEAVARFSIAQQLAQSRRRP
jgi:F0F1-type ATP synthase epsilon subunit